MSEELFYDCGNGAGYGFWAETGEVIQDCNTYRMGDVTWWHQGEERLQVPSGLSELDRGNYVPLTKGYVVGQDDDDDRALS